MLMEIGYTTPLTVNSNIQTEMAELSRMERRPSVLSRAEGKR